jgi:GMP synthase-like glutamine amidotransferase
VKHLSIVQHTQSEWLGAIEDHLEGRGVRFSYFRPFTAGGALPNVMTLGDGLVMIGGGPWGAATPGHQPPWLDAEIRLARACLMMSKPVIGFGLGSQILAIAADGAAEPGDLVIQASLATRTRPDALGGLLPERFPSVVYMRDRPAPPPYADILARHDDGSPAVFSIGANAFGFAGHPGLRPAMIEDLIMEFDDAPAGCAEALPQVRELARPLEDALVPIMTGLVRACGWMEAPPA